MIPRTPLGTRMPATRTILEGLADVNSNQNAKVFTGEQSSGGEAQPYTVP